ncbi:reverse transcriptase domain-containing protein [Tanacetum coccineum]
MAKMFLEKYFPPSMVTKLRNEITNFRQRPDESLFEAWERYKLSIDRCPNHNMLPVTQIDTFYNGLTLRHRDTINANAGWTFMKRRPEECYDLIKNMTAHHNDWDTSAQRSESSSSITSSSDPEIVALKAEMAEINKNLMKKCFKQTKSEKQLLLDVKLVVGQHAYNDCPATVGQTQNVYAAGAWIVETEVIKDTVPPTINESTKGQSTFGCPISRNLVPSYEPVVATVVLQLKAPHYCSEAHPKTTTPISFASPIKTVLLAIKKNCIELARTLLNEHCSSVLLKKLPKKLRDPGKFLIPCDFPGMDVCLALADLGASINLMPLSVWKKFSLPELTPTCMTLELATGYISRPICVSEDVFLDGESFLKTGRALIDVYAGELTLRVGNKSVTFNLDQTSRYSSNYDDISVNRIDVIDVACEEIFLKKYCGFSGSAIPHPTS